METARDRVAARRRATMEKVEKTIRYPARLLRRRWPEMRKLINFSGSNFHDLLFARAPGMLKRVGVNYVSLTRREKRRESGSSECTIVRTIHNMHGITTPRSIDS